LDNFEHGQGTYTYKSKNTYVGEFQFGFACGKGTYRWVEPKAEIYAGGIVYEGEFEAGKPHGKGYMTWFGDEIEALKEEVHDGTVIEEIEKTWEEIKAEVIEGNYQESDWWKELEEDDQEAV